MSIEHRFTISLPNGLHARPASHLAEVVGTFACSVSIVNERTGRTANAKSVLALVGAGCRTGDPCRLICDGVDELTASRYLARYVADILPFCDEPLTCEETNSSAVDIPRSLKAVGLADYHTAKSICDGIGAGALVPLRYAKPAVTPRATASDTAGELARFHAAAADLRAEYAHLIGIANGPAVDVLQAHSFLLGDPVLIEAVTARVNQGLSALQAVAASVAEHAEKLRQTDSVYLHERVADLEDIETRLLEKIHGPGASPAAMPLAQPAIVVADQLTPSQLLALDRKLLRGLILGQTGATSHTAILARSFGIPTLIGLPGFAASVIEGDTAIVDGYLGLVVRNPSAGVRRYYEAELKLVERLEKRGTAPTAGPTATVDGRRIEIAANIVSHHEAGAVFGAGADGIGLFRTELLFADRSAAPDEEEQYAAYAAAVRAARGRTVIIRTLDIGGDKPVPFLPMPTEANPFLGYRGMRLYREHQALVETQLRALLRAAALGPLWILVPMVASVEEARFVRRCYDALREQLGLTGAASPEGLKFGLMLEVPSTAFAIDELCAEADFFSVGSNDLAQYFFAADRGNEKVADRYEGLHPAFLRLLHHIVERTHARGRWIGLCGRLAEDPEALPALVGLGFDELSVPASCFRGHKARLALLDSTLCTEQLRRALECPTAAEARKAFSEGSENAVPMITPELVLRDLDCETKEEVIHAMIGALRLAGRTDKPAVIEETLWRREETYSTGFGDGFAMPHGKTDAVSVNSIVVAQLRRPVHWKSLDDAPVDVVLMLLIRESGDTHMHLKCISRLSRLLMQEPFRARLRGETDPVCLAAGLIEDVTS